MKVLYKTLTYSMDIKENSNVETKVYNVNYLCVPILWTISTEY